MRLLVTGGAGFIGSAFVRRRLASTDDSVIVLDKLTYAGNRANLASCAADPASAARFRFEVGDICEPADVRPLLSEVDAIVNFAAETHVDRSILDAEAFLRTGIIGVHVLLEAAREQAHSRPMRYVQVSTDEVYGDVPAGLSLESDPLRPRSPYAAAKSAGDLLVSSYHATFGLDVLITRGANTFGPFQHPEKLVPLFITNALDDLALPLYGDGMQERDWLYVDDHADAIGFVLDHGQGGEAYNVPGTGQRTNRALTATILRLLDKPWSLVRSVPDRPGHDLRYAMDGAKLSALGWRGPTEFEAAFAGTVTWFSENTPWWRAVKSGDWADYYENQYGWRLAHSFDA